MPRSLHAARLARALLATAAARPSGAAAPVALLQALPLALSPLAPASLAPGATLATLGPAAGDGGGVGRGVPAAARRQQRELSRPGPRAAGASNSAAAPPAAAAAARLHGSNGSTGAHAKRTSAAAAVVAAAAAAAAAAASGSLADQSADSAGTSSNAAGTSGDESSGSGGRWKPHLLSLNTRQRVFFNYEKRIRDKSSLEKVFDYFSSQETPEGIKTMLPQDLLQAVVPTFPASKSTEVRAGYLEGERKEHANDRLHAQSHEFFSMFDIDRDGVLSYMEFLLVLTLVSIPKLDVHVIFAIMDSDNSGLVDAKEFDVIIKRLQDKANLNVSKYTVGRSSKLLSDHVGGLMTRFFGPDLTGKLSLSEFSHFLDNLHMQLVRLEFEHYLPNERGMIPGIDFARSLVTAAEMVWVDELLNKVDAHAGELADLEIGYPEFEQVYELQTNMDPVGVALEFMDQVGRPVTKEELVKVVAKLTGLLLSEHVAGIIALLFGDADGHLNVPLFLDTMKRRGYFWARRGNGEALVSRNRVQRLFSCIQACNADVAA